MKDGWKGYSVSSSQAARSFFKKLFDDGAITGEEAYLNAYDKSKFEQLKDA